MTHVNGRRAVCRAAFAAALAAWLLAGVRGGGDRVRAAGFDTKTADFAVAFNDQIGSYREMAAFVMPSTPMTFEVVERPSGTYSLSAEKGTVAQFGAHKWRWTAPDKTGVYTLKFEGPAKALEGLQQKKDVIELRVFVMVPAADVRDGLLNGYKIGAYPPRPLKGDPNYIPPAGFIEVTKANQDTKVSPHFQLKQFLCKQGAPNDFPKYLVLQERLPLKLEGILEEVNALGFDVDTLHVMSGYRTPFYNHAIGDVLYSMHQWGSAADFYIDKHDKGVMDDLNGDGRVDIADSKFLYDDLERWLMRPGFQRYQGGMGYYPPTSAHPPFVHVDVRGNKARWKG